MTRQIIMEVADEDHAWLAGLADNDRVSVGEIVRRCVRWARENQEPAPSMYAGPTPEELERHRIEILRQQEQQRREQLRQQRIAQARAALEAAERDEEEAWPVATPEVEAPSVLDVDWAAIEPRAEEIEVPPDPDDGPPTFNTRQLQRSVMSAQLVSNSYSQPASPLQTRPVPTLLDQAAAAGMPPSGMRPGTATRPAPPNKNLAVGMQMGDASGNVVRANFPHLGFARGQ